VSEARRVADALMRFGAAGAAPIAALAILTVLDARTGDTTAARQHLANLLRAAGTTDRPAPAQGFLVGWPLVAVGDTEQALNFLERVQPRGAALSFYLRFPEFDPVRSHPRFQRLVAESLPR
jgi:hypothetical protein